MNESLDSTGRVTRPRAGQEHSGLAAMNVEMSKWLAQSARGESLCLSCHRPWFGLVAYCPYCGRKAGPAASRNRPSAEDALRSREESVVQPTLPVQLPEDEPPRREPELTAFPGVPPIELHRSPPTAPKKAGNPLLFKSVLAGVGALLLAWAAVYFIGPLMDKESPAQLSSSTVQVPRQAPQQVPQSPPTVPSQLPQQVPPQVSPQPQVSQQAQQRAPQRTPQRVQRAPQPTARTEMSGPPSPPARSLCSAADQAAGLCKAPE